MNHVPKQQPVVPFVSIGVLFMMLGGVYTIQSSISMLTLQSLPALLRSQGIATDKIGLVYLLMLPWALKFLWSPFVERFRKTGHGDNHARLLLLIGGGLITILFMIVAYLDQAHQVAPIFIGLIFITFVLTVVDTAADGFAIDKLTIKQRPWANMVQVGGSYFGTLLGSGLFLYLIALYSWWHGIMMLALTTLLLSAPAWFIKRSPQIKHVSTINQSSTNIPSLKQAIKRPRVRRALILILLCMVGTRISLAMMMPYLIDKGINLAELGILAASGGALAGLIGVVIGGPLVRYLGASISLIWILLFEAVLFGVFIYSSWQTVLPFYFIASLFVIASLITAIKFVTLYTLLMGYAAGKQPGVDFALMQSTDMMIAIICSILSGIVVTQWSYSVLFIISATFTIIAFIYCFVVKINNEMNNRVMTNE